MPKKSANVSLKSFDDIFSTEESRQEDKLEHIRQIPISELHAFEGHPFRVVDDEEMQKVVDSVAKFGVLTPLIARPDPDGGYEVISGHRRMHASELAGIETVPVIVREMDDDEAIICMVDANLQRENILPSERAWAYRMKMDAIRHQGLRSDLTSATPLQKSGKTSRQIIADSFGESHEQVRKYIRLTYLIPELLQLVDEGKMKMRPAVELSYLNVDFQKDVLENIELNDCSHAQTIRMRRLYEEHSLTPEVIADIMCEQKPNQRERMVFNGERMRKLLPRDLPMNKTEDYICEAIAFYRKHNREHEQSRKSNRDAR